MESPTLDWVEDSSDRARWDEWGDDNVADTSATSNSNTSLDATSCSYDGN